MLTKRIIPCLDVKDGRVVKSVNFVNLRDAGDAVQNALFYDKEGADELVFLDITASYEKRKTTIRLANKVAESIFLPFTVGGGISTLDDIRNLLNAGCEHLRYLLRGFAAHLSKVTNFLCNHGKSFATFASSRGLNRSVERKKLGLENNVIDNFCLISDL